MEKEDFAIVRRRSFRIALEAVLAALAAAAGLAGDVEISEILAVNATGRTDEDGDRSDWIEVLNRGSVPVDLDGWSLSDDPGEPGKWRFPSEVLDPGQRLLVFVSGKARSAPGKNLHTNFRIAAEGEYLGLFHPDGTLAHGFLPSFPPQAPDVSFGIAETSWAGILVETGAACRWRIPAAGDGALWTLPGFGDGGWSPGATGLGFDLDDKTPGGPPNIARGGLASQSTIGFGGFASRAIDENVDGDFAHASTTHTYPTDPTPWWQVDLKAEGDVERIVIWNRTDCCSERLSNFRVSVLDEDGRPVVAEDRFTDGDWPRENPYTVLLPAPVRGRFVRIEKLGPDRNGENILSLAEVEVYGSPPGFRAFIATDLEAALSGRGPAVDIRIPFEVADPAAIEFLRLEVRYDDGFVAWLNGQEVTRRNAPEGSDPAAAPAERPDADAVRFEGLDISLGRGALLPGTNILALRGLTAGLDDRDFLLSPRLMASSIRAGELRYFTTPTPGEPNPADGLLGIVAPVRFGRDRGFCETPFDLELACDTPGAAIRFTLDGSLPSATRGSAYVGPIRIASTAVVRAAAFRDGFLPSRPATMTYLFLDKVVRQDGAGFPKTWGSAAADYGMDPNVVNDPRYRDTIRSDLKTIPSLSIVMAVEDLFGPQGIYSNPEARGDAWERACSAELIHPDGRGDMCVDCGIRIYGYGWRSHSATLKHAFRLVFRRTYGPAKLEYPFFPGWPIDRFQDIVLRSQGSRGWNDFRPSIEQTCYIRDAWSRSTERAMGKLSTSSTYVQLYLNGLYWGLYNPVEHPDAPFLAEHLGGSEEDYDALNARVGQIEVIDGSRKAWDDLIALARAGVPSLAAYQRIQESLDVTDLIDFLLINFYTGNQDWVGSNGNNMRVAGGPAAGVGFKSFCWDMEYSIWDATDNVLAVRTDFDTPALLHAQLRANPEYRMAFADRVRRHLFHGGALTPEKTAGRWMALAGEIDRAIVGESARWGDRRREPPYTRDVEWVRERDRLLGKYFPQRTAILLEQLAVAGLYPRVEAPEFGRHGGTVPEGFRLSMTAPAGTILYTVDGSDPRQPGGAVAAGAAIYEVPVAFDLPAVVKARARSGSVWSALTEARFDPLGSALRIAEILYRPLPPTPEDPWSVDDLEFIELQNIAERPLDLAGYRLVRGVQFAFPAGSRAASGGIVIIARNRAAFEARYGAGLPVAGEYVGRLDDDGERVTLEDPLGRTVLDFRYSPEWYPSTAAGGRSLVVDDPRGDPILLWQRSGWRPSAFLGGSPGREETAEPPSRGFWRPGDFDGDGRVDLSDAVDLLGILFLGTEEELPCGGDLGRGPSRAVLDANGDLQVDLGDAIAMLFFLFGSGPAHALGDGCVPIDGCRDACVP